MAGKGGFLDSKIRRTVLVLLTAFLIFIGPTYMIPFMQSILNIPDIPSKLMGLIFFIIGILFLWLLIRKQIISER